MNEDAIRQLTQALNANTEARMNPQGAGPRVGVPIGGGFSAFLGGAAGINFFKKLITNSVSLGIVSGFKKTFANDSLQKKIQMFESPEYKKKTESIIKKTIAAGQVDDLPIDDKIKESLTKPQEDLIKSIDKQVGRSGLSSLMEQIQSTGNLKGAPEAKDLINQIQEQFQKGNITGEGGTDELIARLTAIQTASTDKGREFAALLDQTGNVYDTIRSRLQGQETSATNRTKDAISDAADQMIGAKIKTTKLLKLASNFAKAGGAILAFIKASQVARKSFLDTAQQVGGVDLERGFRERIDATFRSILNFGRFSGADIIQAKGAFSQEFGGLLTGDSAERLVETSQRTGVAVQQLVGLERALQGTGIEAENAIRQFKQVGIVGSVAAEEIAKNAGAVARAGDKFNSFIVEGIKNAKRLGLEFGKIEQTLTGFATNFEGTIDQFAGLRAVIPGFETDFNQLFSTALYGSTDDFVDLVRSGLQGAGISSVEGMSRTALAQLEQSTGFTADQIERILQNEDVNFDVQQDLDTKRNNTLQYILTAIGALIGVAAVGFAGLSFGTSLVIGAAATAGLGTVGYQMGKADDMVSKPGYGQRTLVTPTGNIALNNQDQLIAGTNLYGKGELSGPSQSSVSMQGVEVKLDKLYAAVERQTQALQRGLRTEITGIDKGLTQLKDAEDRGLVYG